MSEDKNFQKYFYKKILSVINLESKGNNRILEVITSEGKFALKIYSRRHFQGWDRGGTEFKTLSYLWKKGFREISQPIKFYREDNIGVYTFAEGKILKTEEIGRKDINKAINFLIHLHKLGEEDKKKFSPASSACLNLQEYINVLESRFQYIKKGFFERNPEIRDFLLSSVRGKITELKNNFLEETKDLDITRKIGLEQQVLTPADFGFHNILKNGKEYTFLDFEYFGRDDPVRQILDFIYHGSSRGISEELKSYFMDEYLFSMNDLDLRDRLKLLTPLIKMAWILICLNPFNAEYEENILSKHLEGDYIKKFKKKRFEEAKKRFEELP